MPFGGLAERTCGLHRDHKRMVRGLPEEFAAMAVRLRPFPADSAEVVSGWARTPEEVAALCSWWPGLMDLRFQEGQVSWSARMRAGPAGAGAGFGDVAATVSLPAPAAQSRGPVRALVRLATAGPRDASGTGREADEALGYPSLAGAPGAGARPGCRQGATASMTAVSSLSGTAAACRGVL